MKNLFALFFSLTMITTLQAQEIVQNIRGQVIDQQTGQPLIGANVVVQGTDPLVGTATDLDGYYRIEGLALGRYNLICTYVGYGDQALDNILLTSGKEVAVNFELLEGVTSEEVVVTAITEKNALESGLAVISAKTITAEQSNRFSGTRGDVSRMVSSFAGVTANDDSRNDIVVRGNSPAGLLWRVDGIDIPNPSHFGALGATGGPVSMLNNNVLDKSIFLTGAFPANYGNALSGVFDLSLKNGNRDTREYMVQMGFAGLEAGIEGPFKKGKNATYIVNYRYSVLDLLKGLGLINVGTGSGVPAYQDLTFNFNIPTEKAGEFSVFGIGGTSNILFTPVEEEEADNLFSDENQQLDYATRMGFVGFGHKYYFGKNTFGKFTAGYSATDVKTAQDTLSESGELVPNFRDKSSVERLTVRYEVKRKFNAKNNLTIGAVANRLDFNFLDSVRINENEFRTTRNFEGAAWLTQAYAQWQHRFSDRTTLNLGAYYQGFGLNNNQSIEPRLGFQHELSPAFRLNAGAGRYSQLQPFQLYFVETPTSSGTTQTNKNLEFSYSNQAAIGFAWDFLPGWNTKVEGYYQSISNAPVDPNARGGYYSGLNEGADFGIASRDSLINDGVGTNYGVEITLEKLFSKGFYLLSTVSLFDSKYTGSDNVERSTAFDNGWVANLITGKEFVLNKKFALTVDTKITAAGGRRYTPIDLNQSIIEDETVLFRDQTFNNQFKDYFRMDLKVGLRNNMKKFSQEWSVDLQNLLDTQNVFAQTYSNFSQDIQTTYQLGRYPVINYKLEF